MEDLKATIFSMKAGKISGPDGFPIKFYKGFMDIIEDDSLVVVEDSRVQGRIHGIFNNTFIALIPNNNRSSSLDYYRPNSLCNAVYKVIAKIISNRVKNILPGFIRLEQFAFLKCRHIHEPIVIPQKVVHMAKTWNKPLALFKVYLSKVYDRVN